MSRPSSCCLDSLVVVKGVTACIFGDADGPGTPPGVAVADCLVGRLLASARYARVLCVCLGRSEEAVRHAARLYLEFQSDDCETLIDTKLSTCATFGDAATALCGSGNNGATAVVIFSMSELLLECGVAASLAAVHTICNSNSGDGGPTVIAVVHTTLHPPHVLAQLLPRRRNSASSSSNDDRGGFNAACFVRGNDGTLAAELACEVQVVRVSSAAGKVHEETDYFAARARPAGGNARGVLAQGPPLALLQPIPQLKKLQETHHAPAAAAASATHTGVSSTITTTSTSNAIIAGNRRLITFDSTDPEFDDDSDPDADLDL